MFQAPNHVASPPRSCRFRPRCSFQTSANPSMNVSLCSHDSEALATGRSMASKVARQPLERYLDQHGIGGGKIEARQIGDGHSNVTYCLTRGDAQVVLRRPPRPPLPPSAHDVLREARVLRGLSGSEVPVPEVLATC